MRLDLPIQILFEDIQMRLTTASSDPKIKIMALDAQKKLAKRIAVARTKLQKELEESLRTNQVHFTTEDDIKCPVAREMKTAYARINMMRMEERPNIRHGIYKDQRAELIRAVSKANDDVAALIDVICEKIKIRQCKKWRLIIDDFIAEINSLFEAFARAMAELLEDEEQDSGEHGLVRSELAERLCVFSKELKLLKDQFPVLEAERAAKKARVVEVKEAVEE